MKRLPTLLFFFFIFSIAFEQNNGINKIILIPHPRSNDAVNQSVQPGIENIDLSNYDMTLLGGDLTCYTTIDYPTMDYCDSLFDLGNPNTLWTLGNHDMNHPEYVSGYTHRSTYYAYYIQ